MSPQKVFLYKKEPVKWEALQRSSSDKIFLKELVEANEELKSSAIKLQRRFRIGTLLFAGDLINRSPDTFLRTIVFNKCPVRDANWLPDIKKKIEKFLMNHVAQ